MPIYRKGKDAWRVVVVLHGSRRDSVIRGTRREAEAHEARVRMELVAAGHGPTTFRTAPRFCDFCVGTYRRHAETALRASTWSIRQYHIATLLRHLGNVPLDEIDTGRIEAFKQARRAEGRAARTVNAELASLQAILAYARRIGAPCAKPALVPLRAVKSHRAKPWTSDEIGRLLRVAAAEAPFLVPLLTFLVNTGCRKTEALHVTWEHIDFERALVRIWPSDEWRPKDDEPREIPMSDALRAVLRVLYDAPTRAQSPFVFTSSGGDRYASWPKRSFDRVRKLAGLTGGPHTLRHTFASHFLAARPDMFVLAKILGHADLSITRVYSHLLPGHLEHARNAVNISPVVLPLEDLLREPHRGAAGRWAKRIVPLEVLPESALPLPEVPTTAEDGQGPRAPRRSVVRPELAAVRAGLERSRLEDREEAIEISEGSAVYEDDATDARAECVPVRRQNASRSLPGSLPANDIGALACARAPKKSPSSRRVTGLDVLGIEPRTSRVRFSPGAPKAADLFGKQGRVRPLETRKRGPRS